MDPQTGAASICDATGSTLIGTTSRERGAVSNGDVPSERSVLCAEFASRSGYEAAVFIESSMEDTGRVLDRIGVDFTVGVFARLGEFVTHDSARVILVDNSIANGCCNVTAVCGSATDLSLLTESGVTLASQDALDCIADVIVELDESNLLERARAMKLELAAALNNLRYQSHVQSLEIAPGLLAHMRLADNVSAMNLMAGCSARGVAIQVGHDSVVTIAPPLTSTRAELFALGAAIDAALTAVGSHSSAPQIDPPAAATRLTPHERDLLANVPPHHGE